MADQTTSRDLPDGPLLVDAKLRAPPLRDGTLPRPDLVELLKVGCHRMLTLLSAPTGFGKTALLTERYAAGMGEHMCMALAELTRRPCSLLGALDRGASYRHTGSRDDVVGDARSERRNAVNE